MTNFNIWSYCLTLMGGVLTYTENDYSRLTFGGANNYTYNPARPYAVASVQGVPHFPAHSQAVTYNAAQQPTSISEGGIETIGYNHDMQRSCMTVTEGDTVTLTQYYDNASYQRMTRTIGQSQPQTKELLYVGGDPYTAPAVMLKDYGENQWTLCYILRDNLGSVVSVADTLGNDLQHLSYDAWGRLRDPLTLSPYRYREEPELLLGRGYTGHEHLQWCGLINMNARLYDPMVARFLSPDPVVQAPDNTQSLNRYSYCLNNPLKYVDKSGCIWMNGLDKILLCHDINIRITQYQEQIEGLLNNRNLSSLTEVESAIYSDLNDRIKMLQNSLADIDFLDNDPFYYYSLCGIDNDSGKANDILFGNAVYIQTYPDKTLAIHKIAHLANYRRQGYKLSKDAHNLITNPLLHGLSSLDIKTNGLSELVFNDEIDAYKTQYSFCPKSLPVDVHSIFEINRYYVCGLSYNWEYVYFYLLPLLTKDERINFFLGN